jgi:hypothetical protein
MHKVGKESGSQPCGVLHSVLPEEPAQVLGRLRELELMRSLLGLIALLSLLVAAGCRSNIDGETNQPPPAGGPPQESAAHPPGESGSDGDR